jgi:hypothetical protein
VHGGRAASVRPTQDGKNRIHNTEIRGAVRHMTAATPVLDPAIWTGAVPFAGRAEEVPHPLADGPGIGEMGGPLDGTPLVSAASQGHGPVLLLEHGADMSDAARRCPAASAPTAGTGRTAAQESSRAVTLEPLQMAPISQMDPMSANRG